MCRFSTVPLNKLRFSEFSMSKAIPSRFSEESCRMSVIDKHDGVILVSQGTDLSETYIVCVKQICVCSWPENLSENLISKMRVSILLPCNGTI